MNNYRLYRIDGAGRIDAAEWLEAADDRSARDQAASLCVDGGSVELWARDRLVARLDSSNVAETIVAWTESLGSADRPQSAN